MKLVKMILTWTTKNPTEPPKLVNGGWVTQLMSVTLQKKLTVQQLKHQIRQQVFKSQDVDVTKVNGDSADY